MTDSDRFQPFLTLAPDEARRTCRSFALGLRLTIANLSNLAADLPLVEVRLRRDIRGVHEPLIEAVRRLEAISGKRDGRLPSRNQATSRWQRLRVWLGQIFPRLLDSNDEAGEPGTREPS